ncbi:MAG: leucine-rich repeat domain-containing protein [Muribaculaceae bacterium]|nr:leucine-rich repeat domain-containing protein [Muribaculaceae bacterium]
MKRMHKVSYMMMIIILIVLNSVNALADGPDYGPIVNKQIIVGNLGYSLDDDDMTAYLNNGEDAHGDVVIPSKVRYGNKVYTVAIISSCAFADNNNITSIKVPNTVTTIDQDAFYGCYNLTSIQMSNSIEEIGLGAFAHTNIKEITIPEKVKEIDRYTFSGCKVKTIRLLNPNTIIYTEALPRNHKVDIIGGGIVKDYEYKYKILDKNGKLLGYRDKDGNVVKCTDPEELE